MTARLAICVLPFANMSDDPEQEYFSDGITEDIITDLSKVSALQVVSRNSAFTFKGRNVDIPQVARALNVTHVLEGSVRKAAGRLRITGQLIDGVTGGHVWAERYDRELSNIFALQDEISHAIVTALKLKLLPDEKKAIERRGTVNPDAYNLYLMARKHYLNGSLSSTRRYGEIARLCLRATELDHNYAQAWALLALAQASALATFGGGHDDGLMAAQRALGLDPNLAEAHAAIARARVTAGDFAGAISEARLGHQIDPESYEANYICGLAHFALRQHRDALQMWQTAAMISEGDYLSSMMVMTCAQALDDSTGARRAAHDTLARVETLLAQEPDNGTALAARAGALACLGEVDRAREVSASALRIDPTNTMMRYNLARACVRIPGATDEALDLLEPAFKKMGASGLAWVKIEADFDSLREHQRFLSMLATAEARVASTP